MRVTDSMRNASMLDAQTSATSRLYKATQVASSGTKVSAPSDDPGAFARIAKHDAALATLSARKSAVDRAQSDATMAESALASASDIMARVREIAVQMADGSMNAAERLSAANEVTQLRQSLVGIANTQGSSGYLFGGSATATPPFSASGVFSGNDTALQVEIADGMKVRANPSGAQAFTSAGGRDVIADLDALATALTTNDITGIQAGIDTAEAGRDQITKARAASGVLMDRLDTTVNAVTSAAAVVQQMRAADSDADAAEAYSAFQLASQAYERSLDISRKLIATFDLQNR